MSKIQFDIKYRPQIESGEYKVETFSGYPVTIYRWDFDDCEQTPIMGSYVFEDGKEYVGAWNDEGHFDLMSPNDLDLLIVTPEEEMTPFEKGFIERVFHQKEEDLDEENREIFLEDARYVLGLARKQFIKDGYIIEKKAFHDAVKKVDPEVMKEVSENVNKTGLTEFERRIKDILAIKCEIFYNEDIGGCYDLNGLCRVILECAREQLKPDINFMLEDNYKTAYKEGYDEGKAEALKDLPRWIPNKFDKHNFETCKAYLDTPRYLCYQDRMIDVSELVEKLPGFKEDDGHE